jgi:5-bromo-4-chloroindolyl phosphate hydrolysis protein
MKLFLRILFISLFTSLSYGLYYKSIVDFLIGEKIIGFTVLIGTIVFLPLFLYEQWKGKRLQDYTLTEENLKKMRKKQELILKKEHKSLSEKHN